MAAICNGIEPLWASEIEEFPIEVTKARFPQMRHVGDILNLKGQDLPPVDVLTGGSPCQDLSVAGHRAGLTGDRSVLFLEQIRIAKELRWADEQRGRTADLIRPRYFVWENVPGTFSSEEGEDFRVILEEICRVADNRLSIPRPPNGRWESAGTILGEKFSLAWRVLDAQHWGVAQRRKRIFVVADFGGQTAPKILFEQDRLFGDPAQGQGTQQGTAAPARGSPASAGIGFDGYNGDLTGDLAATLGVNCGMSTGRNGIILPESAEKEECLTPWDVQSRRIYGEQSAWPALYGGEGGGHGYVATAYSCNQRDEVRNLNDVSGAICATQNIKQQTLIAMPINTQTATRHKRLGEGTGFGLGDDGDPAYTLQAAHSHGVFVDKTDYLTPWDTQQGRIFTETGVAPTLAGADGGGGRNPAGLIFTSGVVSKGNGDCFLTPETHTSLTSGGGQAGQGFPCVFTAGFSAGASPTASTIGFQDECAPTLKGSGSGTNMVPSVLCLNDQGGGRMDASDDITGSLRAQEHGHQPLILFESHGQDARYNGPLDTSPALSASYGEGGGNIPLAVDDHSFCISGNIIDRQPHNGGNHFGFQSDISYTLNTCDRHAVFSRQRVDVFSENDITSTQSARQYKDATDLICSQESYANSRHGLYTEGCTTLRAQGGDCGGGSENLISNAYEDSSSLVRRLTPLECERLQGFPDYWTLVPSASDTARYKALGNSVAIPCVYFVLRGIAYFLRIQNAA